MTADHPADTLTTPQKPSIPTSGDGLSVQDVEAYNRSQPVFGQSLQDGMVVSFSDTRTNTELQQPVSPTNQHLHGRDMDTTHVLQTSMEQDDQRQQRHSAKLSSRPGASSQMDALMKKNAELRQEIEKLHTDSEQRQTAFEHMLDDVIRCESLVCESTKALAAKDAEIIALRNEVAKLALEGSDSSLQALILGRDKSAARNDELRDLQLQCGRLKVEAERRDEQLREAQEQLQLRRRDVTQRRSLGHDQSYDEIQDLRNQVAGLKHEARENQRLTDQYYQDMHSWKIAYSTLQQSNSDLHRTHSELVQTVKTREAQPKIDEQAVMRVESQRADELKSALEVSDFYKNNSAEVARKNKVIVAENMALQKSLHEMTRELDQQKSLIKTLQT